jgi:hypothetical protein
VGKSTLIQRVLEQLQLPAGTATGFYTEEVRSSSGGQRAGFDVVTLDGKRSVLSRMGRESAKKVCGPPRGLGLRGSVAVLGPSCTASRCCTSLCIHKHPAINAHPQLLCVAEAAGSVQEQSASRGDTCNVDHACLPGCPLGPQAKTTKLCSTQLPLVGCSSCGQVRG